MNSFGVGCFHFSIENGESKTILVKDYVEEIIRTLESLTTISDVICSYDESIANLELDISPPNPRLNEGGGCYPQIPFFDLSFCVYIPSRIQADLIDLPEDYIDTGSENFRIKIVHDWHGPLSYIEPVGAGLDSRPSTGVRVVREYLLREISKVKTFLLFDLLGPSPFHADFHLMLNNSQNTEELFETQIIHRPGYDQVIFACAKDGFSSKEDALQDLYEQLSQELAFFYDLNLKESGKIHRWHEIQEILHSILSFEDDGSKKSIKDRLYLKPKLFRKVFKNIGSFKGQSIFDKSSIAQNYNSIYESDKHKTYLKVFIDKEIFEHSTFPVDETSELLRYFDQKAGKVFELAIVAMAAIIGGIVGSIITVSFS
ncbi:hypothetical protein [Saccharospirillum sp.]|uniref:hypothetical protein n=1 Tax=Saccharospirillum sp. TaxID=2033801 RepID=UPI00349FFABF